MMDSDNIGRQSNWRRRRLVFGLVCVPPVLLSGLWLYNFLGGRMYNDCQINSIRKTSKSLAVGRQHSTMRSQARVINAPHNSRPDFGFEFSLYDEALYLTKVSPYMHVLSQHGEHYERYGISMYHQLHCLDALRSIIGNHSAQQIHDPDHLMHCIDYLSQAVVCAADDTVEMSSRRSKTGKPIIDGAGSIHYCGDSGRIRSIVEDSSTKPLTVSNVEPGDTVSRLSQKQIL